jgi:acetoin utilization deacetylase AcuC-like enzyme
LAAVRAFQPDLVAISAGFDGYRGDPITNLGLEIETFGVIGERLAALCRDLGGRPHFAVLEGGYAAELPLCVESFLTSWSTC